ncbi:uridylate kinase [Colletotrichum scovillei]|uniref:Uridylate kinase n=1 Tax=Colletotrichum scovillei TaxID=1209932 RepID=A0A9P7UC53_9PEZI|nr:uridylate kinase [Colletotrichum scovillei]
MERGEESPHADIIRANMLAGTIGPIEITMAILKDRITKLMEGGTRVFILDDDFRKHEKLTVVDAEPSVAKIHEELVTIVSSVAELLH